MSETPKQVRIKLDGVIDTEHKSVLCASLRDLISQIEMSDEPATTRSTQFDTLSMVAHASIEPVDKGAV